MRVFRRWHPRPGIEVAFGFEWRDIWSGLFIDPSPERLRLYVIAVPCLPFRITWDRR